MEDVAWITKPPIFFVDGDGVFVTLVSGPKEHTFQISRRLARTAIHVLGRMLDEADREQRVHYLNRKRSEG